MIKAGKEISFDAVGTSTFFVFHTDCFRSELDPLELKILKRIKLEEIFILLNENSFESITDVVEISRVECITYRPIGFFTTDLTF